MARASRDSMFLLKYNFHTFVFSCIFALSVPLALLTRSNTLWAGGPANLPPMAGPRFSYRAERCTKIVAFELLFKCHDIMVLLLSRAHLCDELVAF